ncbi:MAG TPA: winged helix DNA-binding domain-containing protein [Mycobacteriales bacterium]|nr:winged helix DNA-binding domain-containing protein [Mycobacteriales bacterium]
MIRVLRRRELGRATLARQLLLDRAGCSPLSAIRSLAGLNAQLVPTAYLSLAARLSSFETGQLVDLLRGKQIARANLMRGTIHLLDTEDYVRWRPALQPVLERVFRGFNAKTWREVDPDRVRFEAEQLLRTVAPDRGDLRRELGSDAAMFFARVALPLVQIPPAGEWGTRSVPRYAWAETWFERELPAEGELEDLIRRYLSAFGPASVADIQYWSGFTGLSPVCKQLGLAVFEDENGKQLYDVPDAPLPDAGIPAPVRLLPEFDNLVFAHADRTRIVPAEAKKYLQPKAGQFRSPLLVDGMVAGTWRWERARDRLAVAPFETLPSRYGDEVRLEAERTAAFLSPSGSAVIES